MCLRGRIVDPNAQIPKPKSQFDIGRWDLGFGPWDLGFLYASSLVDAYVWATWISSRISCSVSTRCDDLARRNTRSTTSSAGMNPCCSSQNTTFDLPESGPTSIC